MTEIPQNLKQLLDERGVEVSGTRQIDHGTQYRLARGPETATLNVYRTGKVSEGGKPSGLKSLLECWRLSQGDARGNTRGNTRADSRAGANGAPKSSAPALDPTPRLGTDEAGKGDYFGPLVVAGVRITGMEAARRLQEAGVRDSKALGAGRVGEISAQVLRAVGPENVRVVSLPPEQYEERRTTAGNVNLLLGEINARIISELGLQVEKVVVDEFARSARECLQPFVPEGVRLEVRTRAEDDAAVAAASILARARYLEALDLLSDRVGFGLPRGATHVVAAARRVYRERGMEGLRGVAKVSFATTRQVLGNQEEREAR